MYICELCQIAFEKPQQFRFHWLGKHREIGKPPPHEEVRVEELPEGYTLYRGKQKEEKIEKPPGIKELAEEPAERLNQILSTFGVPEDGRIAITNIFQLSPTLENDPYGLHNFLVSILPKRFQPLIPMMISLFRGQPTQPAFPPLPPFQPGYPYYPMPFTYPPTPFYNPYPSTPVTDTGEVKETGTIKLIKALQEQVTSLQQQIYLSQEEKKEQALQDRLTSIEAKLTTPKIDDRYDKVMEELKVLRESIAIGKSENIEQRFNEVLAQLTQIRAETQETRIQRLEAEIAHARSLAEKKTAETEIGVVQDIVGGALKEVGELRKDVKGVLLSRYTSETFPAGRRPPEERTRIGEEIATRLEEQQKVMEAETELFGRGKY